MFDWGAQEYTKAVDATVVALVVYLTTMFIGGIVIASLHRKLNGTQTLYEMERSAAVRSSRLRAGLISISMALVVAGGVAWLWYDNDMWRQWQFWMWVALVFYGTCFCIYTLLPKRSHGDADDQRMENEELKKKKHEQANVVQLGCTRTARGLQSKSVQQMQTVQKVAVGIAIVSWGFAFWLMVVKPFGLMEASDALLLRSKSTFLKDMGVE